METPEGVLQISVDPKMRAVPFIRDLNSVGLQLATGPDGNIWLQRKLDLRDVAKVLRTADGTPRPPTQSLWAVYGDKGDKAAQLRIREALKQSLNQSWRKPKEADE